MFIVTFSTSGFAIVLTVGEELSFTHLNVHSSILRLWGRGLNDLGDSIYDVGSPTVSSHMTPDRNCKEMSRLWYQKSFKHILLLPVGAFECVKDNISFI